MNLYLTRVKCILLCSPHNNIFCRKCIFLFNNFNLFTLRLYHLTLSGLVSVRCRSWRWWFLKLLSLSLSLWLQGSDPRRSETFRLLQAKNITRPQLKFKEKVDNSNVPFVPKIFIKPNATKPLPSCKCFYYCSKLGPPKAPFTTCCLSRHICCTTLNKTNGVVPGSSFPFIASRR